MKKFICIAAFIAATLAIEDYCNFEHCYGKSVHVACEYDGVR